MADIVTRLAKGEPLSYEEVDSNFINLNNDKVAYSFLETWPGSQYITQVGNIVSGSIPSGLVTGLSPSAKIDTTDASNITSGTLNPLRLPNSGVAPGTYTKVTVDYKGRVVTGTNPTTLAGYGITDAASSNNPVFTGLVDLRGAETRAATPDVNDNSTLVATTAFVKAQNYINPNLPGYGYLKKNAQGVWYLDRRVGFLNNIYYVSKNGNDNNDGTSIETSKLTLKSALTLVDRTAIFNKAQDAANILNSNREFLIEETFGWLSDPANVPTFVNPNPGKCQRDLGYIVDAFIQDLRETGNINTVEAGEAYYVGNTLSYIENQLSETVAAFEKLGELCVLAIRNFDINNYGTKYQKQYATANYVILSGITQEPYPQCSDIASVIGVYTQVLVTILQNGPGSVERAEPTTGSTIYVKTGNYVENNPLFVPAEVSLIGDNLRDVTIIPANPTLDLFWVNNGCYLNQMSFRGHEYPSAAVAFPLTGAGNIYKSPYVQNCTSFSTTGCGMRVDGNLATGLKSMVLDSYTQYNQGGTGVEVLNEGYAQLVSIFTICCDKSVFVSGGGSCSITNSNTDFGNYGLVADGVGPLQYVGKVNGPQADYANLLLKQVPKKPYLGQVVTVGQLYYYVRRILVTDQGSGYTEAPAVTVAAPTGVSGITATARAVVTNGKVTSIVLVSQGRQYTGEPQVTIGPPGPGGQQAVAQAEIYPKYYGVQSAQEGAEEGAYLLSLEEPLPYLPSNDDEVNFYQVSSIIASSHCFEYVGSGTNINTARPSEGGITVPENEVVRLNGGRVAITSTDQSGNFRIGADLILNQNTGTLTGQTFTKSLYATITPLILALDG